MEITRSHSVEGIKIIITYNDPNPKLSFWLSTTKELERILETNIEYENYEICDLIKQELDSRKNIISH